MISGHLFCTHKMPKRTYNVDRRVSPRVIDFLLRQTYTLGSAIGCQIRPRGKPRESRILQHSPFGTPGEPKGIQSVPQGSWISCSAKSTLWDRKLDAKFDPEGSPQLAETYHTAPWAPQGCHYCGQTPGFSPEASKCSKPGTVA